MTNEKKKGGGKGKTRINTSERFIGTVLFCWYFVRYEVQGLLQLLGNVYKAITTLF